MLQLRSARDADCALLFTWANDTDVRRWCLYSEPIAWETHVAWFQNRQNNPASLLLIAEDANNTPIGQIRFDLDSSEAEVGISLDERQRGKGYSTCLITQGIAILLKRALVHVVHAWIKPENLASQRAFERAGFCHQGLQEHHGVCLAHYTLRVFHVSANPNTPYPNTRTPNT